MIEKLNESSHKMTYDKIFFSENDLKGLGKNQNKVPLFYFNTTIVDLKPFDLERQLNDDKHRSFNYIDTLDNTTHTSSLLQTNQFANLSKKYLINKSMTFYQPVKDAEVLAQFESLRLKLSLQQNNTSTRINRTESNLPNKKLATIYSDESTSLLNQNKTKSINFKSSFEQIFQSQSELDSSSLSYNCSSINMNHKSLQSPDYSYDNILKRNDKETNYIKIKDDTSENFKLSNKNSQAQNDYDFPELKKFSKNLKSKSLKDNRASTSMNTSRLEMIRKSAPLLPAPNLPDINLPNKILKQKNVSKILRKSTQSRLNNIYKPTENQPSFDGLKRTSTSETKLVPRYQDLVEKSDNQYVEEENYTDNRKNSINYIKSNSAFLNSKEILLTNDDQIFIKEKNQLDNLSKPKELPNERYHRIKEAQIKRVHNIIGDIPSTLNTMSQIGRVTNVEKLIADKLTGYYSSNNRISNVNN